MPIPKALANKKTKAKRAKSLNVVEIIRDGRIFWQTDSKIPEIIQAGLGFEEIEEGIFEVERPKSTYLPEFCRKIEGFGFKINRIKQQRVISQVAPDLDKEDQTEGKIKLKNYLEAKDAAAKAKEESDSKKEELRNWMIINGVPKDPSHPYARVAKIGDYTVHNSWVKGRETKWDDRNTSVVEDWSVKEGFANEVVQVIVYKTISYSEYNDYGVPEGFEGQIVIKKDAYDWYVRIGAVPDNVHDSFESRSKGYYGVKVVETKESSCSNCVNEIKKTQKFCGECGHKQ